MTEKLTFKERFSFALGATNENWGNWLLPAMVWPVFNTFLLMDAALIGWALLIRLMVDAVSDPFFGWLSDNTRSRFGRRRPFILVGSILMGISFPLFFWFLDEGWSEMTYFWYFLIGSSILITLVSCFNMPFQSLGPEMTPDYDERTSLFALKSSWQKIPEIATFAAGAFLTWHIFNKADGSPDVLAGARVFSLIIGAITIIVGIIMFLNLKERHYDKIVTKQEKVSVKDSIVGALSCKPFIAQLAVALAFGIGTSMLGGLGYNLTVFYVCEGDFPLGTQWNFYMGITGTVLGILGAIAFAKTAHKLGKTGGMMTVLIAGIAVFVLSWFFYNPAAPILQLLASGGIAFVVAGFWMLYGAIGADVIDYDELETGLRREGAFSACGSWIMKAGLAIGMWGSGIVLSLTGFDAALGGDQAPETITNMRLAFAGIPIIGLVIAIIFLKRFGLTKAKSEEIRAQLEANR